MTIETKYDIGQTVYYWGSTNGRLSEGEIETVDFRKWTESRELGPVEISRTIYGIGSKDFDESQLYATIEEARESVGVEG